MNSHRQHHDVDKPLNALRAATRMCRVDGTELIAELVTSVRSVLALSHVLVMNMPRSEVVGRATSPLPLSGFEEQFVQLINSDRDFAGIVCRDVPRIQLELHASDVPFHPAIASLLGTGLRHLHVFEIVATPTYRTTLIGLDSCPTPMPMDETDILDLFISVASRALRTEMSMSAMETQVVELQTALNSRVLIEQAKGALAERMKTSPDTAFDHLRRSARRDRVPLPTAAASVIESVVASAKVRTSDNMQPETKDSVNGGESDNTVRHGFTL